MPRTPASGGARMPRVGHQGTSGVTLIAVVDDDASIRLAADSLFRSRGYAVCTFASAGDFLQSAKLNEAACVITDVRMPVMGGIELQAVLRRRGSAVPFVFNHCVSRKHGSCPGDERRGDMLPSQALRRSYLDETC